MNHSSPGGVDSMFVGNEDELRELIGPDLLQQALHEAQHMPLATVSTDPHQAIFTPKEFVARSRDQAKATVSYQETLQIPRTNPAPAHGIPATAISTLSCVAAASLGPSPTAVATSDNSTKSTLAVVSPAARPLPPTINSYHQIPMPAAAAAAAVVAGPTNSSTPSATMNSGQPQSRVFLVPTVQSDGTVAYSIHHASPLKLGEVGSGRGGGGEGRGVLSAVPNHHQQEMKISKINLIRPANGSKQRQHPMILPKNVQPKIINSAKVIRVENTVNTVASPTVIKREADNKYPNISLIQTVRLPPSTQTDIKTPGINLMGRNVSLPVTGISNNPPQPPIVTSALQQLTTILGQHPTHHFPTKTHNIHSNIFEHKGLPPQPSRQHQHNKPADFHPVKFSDKKPEESFSVAAFVRDFTARGRNARNKQRARGRPRKGDPKVINEKKMILDLKRELGLHEERVKEFGFVHVDVEENDEDEELTDEEELDGGKEKTVHAKLAVARTRSGRVSRPPKRILKDLKIEEANTEIAEDNNGAGVNDPLPINNQKAPINNIDFSATTNRVDFSASSMLAGRRNFTPPARYVCKVCGKLYLGEKKIAYHLKHFPDHGFATPDRPNSSPGPRKATSIESWIDETEVASILDLVGPKILQSCSLWDLLVKKVSSRGLGTVEILSGMFADIQALVMDLKNLVEQCLTNQRQNDDSFSVTLSPMMSSILGQSANGGVERFVLPYNQIPVHYHKLLGFPTGLKHTHPTDMLSPDSTNSIFPPEEENSQMSLSSDITDRPLGDKVVLEDNLGNHAEMDDETQDSTIAPLSGMTKRPRLDSESQSITSPPPQTPDFLHQEEESNLSSTSNTIAKEAKEEQHLSIKPLENDHSSTKDDLIGSSRTVASGISDTSVGTVYTESSLTRLPSFSSIMSGSPKISCTSAENNCQNDQPTISHCNAATDTLIMNSDPGRSLKQMFQSQAASIHLDTQGHSVGGSAPVSPGIDYVRSLGGGGGPISNNSNLSFQRRSSVDQVLLSKTLSSSDIANLNNRLVEREKTGLLEEEAEVAARGSMFSQMHLTGNRTGCNNLGSPDSNTPERNSTRRFSFVPESEPLVNITTEVAMPTIVTSPFQNASDNAVFNVTSNNLYTTSMSGIRSNFLETPPKDQLVSMPMCKSFGLPQSFHDSPHFKPPHTGGKLNQEAKAKSFHGLEMDTEQNDVQFNPSSKSTHQLSAHRRMEIKNRGQDFDCSTNVTYSGELTHPIPSVSPLKDASKDFECPKRLRQTPPSSQSPNLFHDIESVLNETDEFSFHSALSSNVENVPSKTPEKLLASVPPSVIMNTKKPAAILFGNYEDFDKPPQQALQLVAQGMQAEMKKNPEDENLSLGTPQ